MDIKKELIDFLGSLAVVPIVFIIIAIAAVFALWPSIILHFKDITFYIESYNLFSDWSLFLIQLWWLFALFMYLAPKEIKSDK